MIADPESYEDNHEKRCFMIHVDYSMAQIRSSIPYTMFRNLAAYVSGVPDTGCAYIVNGVYSRSAG
jgi:hypothetical protein